MKFNLAGMILFVTWISITIAMLNSRTLWFNDLYHLGGYLIWALVFALPFLTDGRPRLFWTTVALTIVVLRPQPHILSMSVGWTANFFEIANGGTVFGPFGQDKLFAHDESSQTGIPNTLFWTFQTINGPLLIGSLLAIVRTFLDRTKWLIALAPLFLLYGLYWVSVDQVWFDATRLAFQICFIFSLTIPLTSKPSLLPFSLGYAAGTGTPLVCDVRRTEIPDETT